MERIGKGLWRAMLGIAFFGGGASVVTCSTALALSNGRAYEMVSPTFKGGYGASEVLAVEADGESAAFYSAGAFAGAPSGPEVTFDYLARRSETGWHTESLIVPATTMPYVVKKDISPDLNTELALGKNGSNQEEATQQSTEAGFELFDTSKVDIPSSWSPVDYALRLFPEKPIFLIYRGASSDFCHIFVSPAENSVHLLEDEELGVSAIQLFELDRGCAGEPVSLHRVAVDNEGKAIGPTCAPTVGYEGSYQDTFNAIADGGQEVFFTSCVAGLAEKYQLYARLGKTKTLKISKPTTETCSGGSEQVPCEPGAKARASATFVGASEDGSIVFFETNAPLDAAQDKDSADDLYMARIGCPAAEIECPAAARVVTELVQVSHDPGGVAAELKGAVRVSPDGERVYFVAGGDLLTKEQQESLEAKDNTVPHAGAYNFYVYDVSSKQVDFIGDLCTATERSGSAEDQHCPDKKGSDAELWSQQGAEAELADASGRYLVFSSFAQLTPDDTDAAKDVYRYDAIEHKLQRVSRGEKGHHSDGNDDSFNASIAIDHWGGGLVQSQFELDDRVISENGSRVVFVTSEPLSVSATNGMPNVYEWHDGAVSLVSTGNSDQPVEDTVIAPGPSELPGRDIFFMTSQGLMPEDTDGAPDIYDARIGGGFSANPAPSESCSADGCQGPLTNPAPELIPGSVVQPAGESYAPVVVSHKVSSKPKQRRQVRRTKAHGGKAKRSSRTRHGTALKKRRGVVR